MKRFDLTVRAPNGLRRGLTTGTCAAAAAKSAAVGLITGSFPLEVEVSLPEGNASVPVSIQSFRLDTEEAEAVVQKDAGDDPDQTHRAHIGARVRLNGKGQITFHAGEGVGVVRRRGLAVPPGEPAINPVPRQMIQHELKEVFTDTTHRLKQRGIHSPGAEVTLFCPEGRALSRKTFNPRLGIEGGISILGTTGIVEPMSLSAWVASIEIEINVALAETKGPLVFCPGNIGRRSIRQLLDLEETQVIQVSNFLGHSIDHLLRRMEETDSRPGRLVLAGHPGKLLKPLQGEWDTHSRRSAPPLDLLLDLCRLLSVGPELLSHLEEQTSVEGMADLLVLSGWAKPVFDRAAMSLAKLVRQRLKDRCVVEVFFFSVTGRILGSTGETLAVP